MTIRRERRNLYEFLMLAAGPKALSLPVVLTCTLLSVVIHFAPNGNTIEGPFWIRFVVAVCGYLPALGFVALVHLFTRRIPFDYLRIALVFIGYLFGGALRGVFFAVTFFSLGMSPELNLGYRIVSSAIPFGFVTAIATVAVGALSQSRDRIRTLSSKQAELIDALQELRRMRASFEDKVAAAIEARVEKEIAQLAGKPEKAILIELKSLVGDFVRPVSHKLAGDVPDWSPVPVIQNKVKWRETINRITFQLAFRPVLMSTTATVMASPSFFRFFGPQRGAVMLLIVLISVLLVTYLALRTSRAIKQNLPLATRILLITLGYLAIGVASGSLGDLSTRDAVNPNFGFAAGAIVFPTLGWLILLAGAANARSRELEAELAESVEQFNWLRTRINLVNWHDRGELSRLLHGQVQSVLHYGIIRFETHAGKASRDKTLKEMQQQLQDAFNQKTTTLDLATMSEGLVEFWRDICEIEINMSASASAALDHDYIGRSVAWDIIKESCVNAIRHGKATKVQVNLETKGTNLLMLRVANNGQKPARKSTTGLGTSILDACTLNWSLKTLKKQVVLTARIPVEKH